ncbi:Uncharacterised protein [Mycobacteroides abscessus subsp. abscessus]|nr:Uncharacterised protein [Mycobacteroides abscessus subsp. abscessus]
MSAGTSSLSAQAPDTQQICDATRELSAMSIERAS